MRCSRLFGSVYKKKFQTLISIITKSRICEYKTFQWTTNSPNTLESSFRYKGTHSAHLLSVANNDNQYLQLAAFREMINYVC